MFGNKRQSSWRQKVEGDTEAPYTDKSNQAVVDCAEVEITLEGRSSFLIEDYLSILSSADPEISSANVAGNLTRPSIHFSSVVRSCLIPTRKEMERLNDLYWRKEDIAAFKSDAVAELRAYVKKNGGTAKQAISLLYQPKAEELKEYKFFILEYCAARKTPPVSESSSESETSSESDTSSESEDPLSHSEEEITPQIIPADITIITPENLQSTEVNEDHAVSFSKEELASTPRKSKNKFSRVCSKVQLLFSRFM